MLLLAGADDDVDDADDDDDDDGSGGCFCSFAASCKLHVAIRAFLCLVEFHRIVRFNTLYGLTWIITPHNQVRKYFAKIPGYN